MDGNSTYIGNGFVMHNKGDPLAQTFIVDQEGGCFVTKIDLFFQAKDENLPVRVEIREVINGYPGPRILPFGRKVLEPADVNLSDDATTATTFTFDSPIFLDEGKEFCKSLKSPQQGGEDGDGGAIRLRGQLDAPEGWPESGCGEGEHHRELDDRRGDPLT